MKTINCLPRLFFGFVGLFYVLTAVSCQTTSSPPKSTQAPISKASEKWVKVSSQPPTYYPRGVSEHCPTDHWSGDWIYTDDEKGTRYYIPLRGLTEKRELLIHDALSARSGQKLNEIEADDKEILARNIKNMTLFGPPALAGIFLAGMVGATPDIDIHEFQKDWTNSKEPH